MNPSIKVFFLIPLLLFPLSCGPLPAGEKEPYTGGQVGIASWYGSDFHGRPTASGEVFDMYAMTAAHRTLPLGTIVRVTNLGNGRSARVTINDRGPFVRGRIIDLSYAAAEKLDIVEAGTARVRVEPTGRDRRYVRYIRVDERGRGSYTVQLGAFTDRRNAYRLKEAVAWNRPGVYITRVEISGRLFYRVRVGRFKKMEDAYRLAESLADEGYEVVLMRD